MKKFVSVALLISSMSIQAMEFQELKKEKETVEKVVQQATETVAVQKKQEDSEQEDLYALFYQAAQVTWKKSLALGQDAWNKTQQKVTELVADEEGNYTCPAVVKLRENMIVFLQKYNQTLGDINKHVESTQTVKEEHKNVTLDDKEQKEVVPQQSDEAIIQLLQAQTALMKQLMTAKK